MDQVVDFNQLYADWALRRKNAVQDTVLKGIDLYAEALRAGNPNPDQRLTLTGTLRDEVRCVVAELIAANPTLENFIGVFHTGPTSKPPIVIVVIGKTHKKPVDC